MKRLLGIVTVTLLCSAVLQPARGDRAGGLDTPLIVAPAAAQLWIAWLDGQGADRDGKAMDRAWATGAVLLDRFPDALLVCDAKSAAALRAAAFRVEGPVPLGTGKTVTLVHAKSLRTSLDAIDAGAISALGARIAWRGGRDLIVESDGPLPEHESLHLLAHQALSRVPMRRPVAPDGAPGKPGLATPLATTFEPIIQAMVSQVDTAAYHQWIGNLAGANPVLIHGSPFTFTTRSTQAAQCDSAERYVSEQFVNMGYTDVQYDPYTFSTTGARNVIATLPGLETPQRVYILGGHLDSTSPQSSTLAPGANDNASGVAAVLEAARILRNYPFKSTIRFIAFTGEEQGLYGSAHYAQAAAARGDSIKGAVITDMIAWHSALYQIDIEGQTPWLPLMTVMQDACTAYTTVATQLQFNSFGSDHVSFQNQGFPSFLAIETEYDLYPCYHQTCDTTGRNQMGFGVEVTRACMATVAHLAGPWTPSFYIVHTPLPSTENTAGPYDVTAAIYQIDPLQPDSLLLHWTNGTGYQTALLTPAGPPNQYHASIPGQPTGTMVSYFLTATDQSARHTAHPTNAPASVHRFWIGARQTLFAEGFEGAATGWTHGGTKDDWQLDTPRHLTEDPAAAYAGTRVYGTDLIGLGAVLGRYENSADTWLESPAIDCSNRTLVKLSFARWLAVERSNNATWDYARVLVNGTKIWESPSGANLIDTSWVPQEFDISAVADGNPSVKVRFTLHSDTSVNFGGWNLDEVKVTGIDATVPTDVAPAAVAHRAMLYPNVPNPYNPSTTLRFDLPAQGPVELSIYDAGGRWVRTLVRASLDPGPHSYVWDGRDAAGHSMASGIYLYRLTTVDGPQARKMVLVR